MTDEAFEMPRPGGRADLSIQGPAGILEARLALPEDSAEPERVMLVCHPHPSHGGSLENKVVYTLARAGCVSGLAALRFNFRGVGQSAGTFDQGRGEVEDCLACADWIRTQFPGAGLVLAGFSFGAYVSLVAADKARPERLISVAPPMSYFDDKAPPEPPCPWLVIQGDRDDVVDPEANLRVLRGLPAPPVIEVMEDVGHFFHGQLIGLRERVERALV